MGLKLLLILLFLLFLMMARVVHVIFTVGWFGGGACDLEGEWGVDNLILSDNMQHWCELHNK